VVNIPIYFEFEQVAARQKAADSKAKGGKLASSRNTGDGVIGGVVEATPLHEVPHSLDSPLFPQKNSLWVQRGRGNFLKGVRSCLETRQVMHEAVAPICPFISHKVFSKSFCKSQFPHKSINLFFILVIVKGKLTYLWGN